ncbi:MAG: hypothetical protein EAZ40_09560 [Rhodobacterales bacterium]|nr:MAG: hypothetical protein EAZ40_09560 [Rhodobacterales bacterium]
MTRPEQPAAAPDLLQQEADLVEAGLALQQEGLKLLLAEMQALSALIPHQADPASDAEVEAGFDNLPI